MRVGEMRVGEMRRHPMLIGTINIFEGSVLILSGADVYTKVSSLFPGNHNHCFLEVSYKKSCKSHINMFRNYNLQTL